jgi:hypothetical protein
MDVAHHILKRGLEARDKYGMYRGSEDKMPISALGWVIIGFTAVFFTLFIWSVSNIMS